MAAVSAIDFTPTAKDIERFKRFLVRDAATGCLLYTGIREAKGHGHFTVRGRKIKAHRFAWVAAGRVIPPGHDVMHHCPGGDRPACCDVEHLGTGTDDDHGRDRSIKLQVRRSRKGLPFGVRLQQNGRFQSNARIGGKIVAFGTFDAWQEAAALAFLHKNLWNFPEVEGVKAA